MEKNKEKFIKFFKFLFWFLLIVFASLFISLKTGYYDYDTYKKTTLTKKAIEKFENDIKEGKNVSINNYIDGIEKDYGNKFSNTGLYISKKVDDIVKGGIEFVFKSLTKMVESD